MDQLTDLEKRIVSAVGRKPKNLASFVQIYKIFADRPNLSVTEAQIETGLSSATFYRVYGLLKNAGMIGDTSFMRGYPLPRSIKSGQLPPVSYERVHFASYLTKFKLDEVVPPYDKTKRQLLQEFKEYVTGNSAELERMLFELFEILATVALYNGEISSFQNMVGKCSPPINLSWEKLDSACES